MRLIGNRPPRTWPWKLALGILIFHLPFIALIVITNWVEGTLLSIIGFWFVTIPMYILSVLLNPLRLVSAVLAAFIVYYLMRLDWTPFFRFFQSVVSGNNDNFVRGRRLNSPEDFRQRFASRRATIVDRNPLSKHKHPRIGERHGGDL